LADGGFDPAWDIEAITVNRSPHGYAGGANGLYEPMRLYRERFAEVGLFENSVYTGMSDALSQIRGDGHDLCVATSKPKIYADRIIDHFELRGFFCEAYGSELSGERADKTDLLEWVLASETADPSTTFMIGDRKHDIIGAKNHGLAAVGVLWGYGDRAELEEAGADCLVNNVADLCSQIRGLTSACC
jgi:phosphoglycolate phosphatase